MQVDAAEAEALPDGVARPGNDERIEDLGPSRVCGTALPTAGGVAERRRMRSRAHPGTTRAGRVWTHGLWPLLAGAVVAVGVYGARSAFGVPVLLLVYAGLAVFALVTVWGLSLEFELSHSAVLRISLYAALDVVVLAGLCQLFPRYGLLVAAVVALTSPAALGLIGRARRRSVVGRSEQAASGILVDKVLLERRFDDIVSQLRQSGDFPEA